MRRRAVRVVLVRPEHPANVGAAARVVRNTGLDGIDLVEPGDWRTLECWRTAWGAHDVLEQARVFGTLTDALAQANLAVAFTGKRDREAPASDVREAAAEMAGLAEGERGAFVFGPEKSGLTRGELALCGRRATIPAHPEQPSLNLSHAVMVAGYELLRATPRGEPLTAVPADPHARRATHAEKEQLLSLLREGLLALSALPGTGGYFVEWRNLFQRADLTRRELRLLEHMARRMKTRAGEPGAAASELGVPPPAGERSAAAREPGAGGRAPSAGANQPPTGGEPQPGPGDQGSCPVGPSSLDPNAPDQDPFADVLVEGGSFSIPDLKWRELLFVGTLRREGGHFVRDSRRPLPPFAVPGLFPDGASFRVRRSGARVHIEQL